MAKRANSSGVNLGFEAQLWAAAGKLSGATEPSDHKHFACRMIFPNATSDAFQSERELLPEEDLADAENPDGRLAANVIGVPMEEKRSHLRARARQPAIGNDFDDALLTIEANSASLTGVVRQEYARLALNTVMPGDLIDHLSGVAMAEESGRSRDFFRRDNESGRQARILQIRHAGGHQGTQPRPDPRPPSRCSGD